MIEEEIKKRLGDKIIEWNKKNEKRYYILVRKEDLQECVRTLFKDIGLRFVTATGVDNIKNFEILYHFSCDKGKKFFSLRVKVERDNPEVPSISWIIKGAKWTEQEIWELLGINFTGHPRLERLLLADDWPKGVYPLRKDYTQKLNIKNQVSK